MHDDDRCTEMIMGGGRGYAAHRCGKRALVGDPDGVCRVHRLEREGHEDTGVEAERRWRVHKDRERRLRELSRHLVDFYCLPVAIEYNVDESSRPCTGRLLVDAEDLLRVLRAQDLMPRAVL